MLGVEDSVCSKVCGLLGPQDFLCYCCSLLLLVLATIFVAGMLYHWKLLSGGNIPLSEYIMLFFASNGRMPGVNVNLQHTSVLPCVRFLAVSVHTCGLALIC